MERRVFREKVNFKPPNKTVLGESVYVGAWRARGAIDVNLSDSSGWSCVFQENWFLASSVCDSGGNLVHKETGKKEGGSAVAFKGYLSDPILPQWGRKEAIIDFWKNKDKKTRYNGVFSAAVINGGENGLTLISDAFGLSPLYYRNFGDIVIFSTSARYLLMPGDNLDAVAVSWLILAGQMVDDRSLILDIGRVPAGSRVDFNDLGKSIRKWYSVDRSASSVVPVNESALSDCEDAFQESMRRILKLGGSSNIIPLSSGDDSRRILASLVSSGESFSSITAKTASKVKGRSVSVDAYVANAMSLEFGFPHKEVSVPGKEEAISNGFEKSSLMSGESTQHDWFVSVSRNFPEGGAVIFDGAGGDVFGNTGYGEKSLYFGSASERIKKTVNFGFNGGSPDIISPFFINLETLKINLMSRLEWGPDIQALSDLIFLSVRTRRGPGFKQQAMSRCGNIVACPYFDLDLVDVTLRLDAVDKLEKTIQARCLERYWPNFYKYPGTRRLPADISKVPDVFWPVVDGAAVKDPIFFGEGGGVMLEWLRSDRRALAEFSKYSSLVGERQAWWLVAVGNASRLIGCEPVWRFFDE